MRGGRKTRAATPTIRGSTTTKPQPAPPKALDYKAQFLEVMTSSLQSASDHATSKPKNTPNQKRSMIPTPKGQRYATPQSDRIVPLGEIDLAHALDFSSGSASPSPLKRSGNNRAFQDSPRAAKPKKPIERAVVPGSPRQPPPRPNSVIGRSRPVPRSPSPLRQRDADAKKRGHSPLPTNRTSAPLISMSPPPSPAEVGDLIIWSSGDDGSPPKPPPVHLHPDMMCLCPPTPLDDLLGLSPPPKPAAFSVKSFVHSLFAMPCETFNESAADNEDVIFAFQERLCSIIEVEVVKQSGRSQQVFPTKLNEYLNQTAKKPVEDEDLIDFMTPKPDGDWITMSTTPPKLESPRTLTPKPRHRESSPEDIPTPKFSAAKPQSRRSPKPKAAVFSVDDPLFEASTPKSILKKVTPKTKTRQQTPEEESSAPKYLITEPIVKGASPVQPDENIDTDVQVMHTVVPQPVKQRFEKADLAFNVSLRDLQLVMAAAAQERQQFRQPVQPGPKTIASALVAADSSDDSD
jgi:hypothetical protein